MAQIVTVRKAVREHSCSSCWRRIGAGKRYIRIFFTPEEVDGLHTDKQCEVCARSSGRHAKLDAAEARTLVAAKKARKAAVPAPAPAPAVQKAAPAPAAQGTTVPAGSVVQAALRRMTGRPV